MTQVLSHSNFPSWRLKQRILKFNLGSEARSVPATGTEVVTKTRFCQITGEPDPRPGTATFHFTFFVLLQVVGGLAVGATLLPVGPRQCPQLSARLFEEASRTTHTNASELFNMPNSRTKDGQPLPLLFPKSIPRFTFSVA